MCVPQNTQYALQSKVGTQVTKVGPRVEVRLKIRVKNSQALEDLLYEIQNWPGVSRTQSNVVLSTYKESTDIDLNILYELINEI